MLARAGLGKVRNSSVWIQVARGALRGLKFVIFQLMIDEEGAYKRR